MLEFVYNIKLVLTSLSKNPKRLKHIIDDVNVTYIAQDLSENNPQNHTYS